MVEIEAYSVWAIFVITSLFKVMIHLLNYLFVINRPSDSEKTLIKEIAAVRREAAKNNFPSTFMTWAKLSRKANNMEKKLNKMKDDRNKKYSQSWRKNLGKLTNSGLSSGLLMIFFYMSSDVYLNLERMQPGLLPFDEFSMYPFGYLLSLGLPKEANLENSISTLSPVGWFFICERVVDRLLSSFS